MVGPQGEPRAEHTYTLSGTYTVTLTVTDTAGRSSTTTRQVTATGGIVTNSSFESVTSGWNTSGSGPGVTLARVAGGHSGAWAAQHDRRPDRAQHDSDSENRRARQQLDRSDVPGGKRFH